MLRSTDKNADFFEANRTAIDAATRSAVIAALQAHKRAGRSVAGWKHSRVADIPASEILADESSQDDHGGRAGNIGDVFKHACLLSLFKTLSKRAEPPAMLIDTHCGFASYPLKSLRCQNNTDEWRDQRKLSLATLENTKWDEPGLRELKKLLDIAGKAVDGRYPGSPELAMQFLPRCTELVFYDLNHRAVEDVERRAKQLSRGDTTAARWSNGFDGALQEMRSWRSDGEGRLLIFCDPAYKGKQGRVSDWHRVQELAVACSKHPNVSLLVWYAKQADFPKPEALQKLTKLDARWAEVSFSETLRPSQWLRGCGLLWLHLKEMKKIAAGVGEELESAHYQLSRRRIRLELTQSV